ncbi:MAG: leucine-rich repeat domain-containing protein [Paludibacteraceae bacterium]|nr:leucine-rich repeat domain-containing protein [Paludibacteraceae bacterium]
MKKLFTLIVAICATTLAWADASGSCGENVTYSFVSSTGTLTISGTGDMNDYDYTSQVPWYYLSIKNVVINNGVTSIGDYAFYNCKGLTSVTIPNSVTSIGFRAFEGCTGLTSVTIPNSVTSIGYEAFVGCTGLTAPVYNTHVFAYMPKSYSGAYSIPNSVTSISSYAFYGCTGLTSITIQNSVTSIGFRAFEGCTGLTSVTIPNRVTSIGKFAFYDCTGLTSINVAEDNLNYASIDGVLYSKDKNTLIMCPQGKTGSITIPNSVTSIGEYAFGGCTGLTSITIPNSVTSIGDEAFDDCTGLTSITIPNSVTSIGIWAFIGCDNLETADINSQAAFNIYFNHKLTSIILGDDITSIGSSAFNDYTRLTSINVAEDNLNYASIDGVLYSKDKKTLIKCPDGKTGSVTIPNSVTSVGEEAFRGCTGLTSVTIPNSVTSIGFWAFLDCTGLTSITIPNSVTSIGNSAFYRCTGLTSVTISNSVTSIGSSVFSGCTGLTSVTIPNSVTSIGELAFYDCTGLTSITIPNSVTSIGDWAFNNCTGLTSMTVEATNPPLCFNESGDGLYMPNYNIPLYVPAASVDAYKAADEWKKFTNIQAIPATGVNEAAAEKSEVKKIIDRNGIIYIEKDGTRYFLNGGKAE